MKKIACCIFKIKAILLTAITIVCVQYRVVAQELTVLNKMKWFAEARFGMFIHWGVFAVPAGSYQGKIVHGRAGIPDYSEWIMYNAQIPCNEYKAFAKQFTAAKYKPAEWVQLAKAAGMKYMVITTKHHDGFALFDTKASNFNMVQATPYGKDAIKALVAECKKQNMKVGFYYSQAQDWTNGGSVGLAGMGNNAPPAWDSTQKQNMEEYVNRVAIPQLRELLTNYGDDVPAILWWDTPRGMTKELGAKINALVHELKPNIIMNNRLGGGQKGDTKTPEQFIPPLGYPGEYWETCMTTNDSWGFQSYDTHWKSDKDLIKHLVNVLSKGGNYLLNIGPDKEGVVPKASVDILKKVGKWVSANQTAIYGTNASPFAYLPWGRCTQKGNALYLHVFDFPQNGKLKIPLTELPQKAYSIINPTLKITYQKENNYVVLDLPKTLTAQTIPVIALEMKTITSSIAEPIPSVGKSVSCSSFDNDKTKPEAVLDGKENTFWRPANNATSGWLSIDLGKPTSIGAFALGEKAIDENIQLYNLEYLENNAWKIIKAGHKVGGAIMESFSPVKAQHFRINILSAKITPQITEFQLFYDE